MRRAFVALACVAALGCAHASADARGGWARYDLREPSPARITRVVIPARCINAEDSAAHLVLRAYDNDVARYACARTGY